MSSAPTAVLRLGTRGSALALTQARIVTHALCALHPGLQVETHIIRTHGDERPAGAPGEDDLEALTPGEGEFVSAIEAALLEGRIDVAVHSYKDMPSIEPDGLTIGALVSREDPRDVLVTGSGADLAGLPIDARIGTGSPRRRAALLSARPDVRVEAVRGNVDTRLRLVSQGAYDGVVLAAAGLKRLGREAEITEWLDPEVFVPAIGQGILAVQVRSRDSRALDIVSTIDDADTRACGVAERAVALEIQAGCSTAVGAYARVAADRLRVAGFLLAADGVRLVRAAAEGPLSTATVLGTQVGRELMAAA